MDISDENKSKTLKEIEEDIEKKYEKLTNPDKKEIYPKEKIDVKTNFETIEKNEKKIKEDIPKREGKKPVKAKYRKSKNIISDYFESIKNKIEKPDRRGETVYLEENGKKIGVISDQIEDKDGKIISLKVRDEESNTDFIYPIEQFDYDKKGMTLKPKWFYKADKDIKKIQYLDTTHPELKNVLNEKQIDEEFFSFLINRDKDFYNYFIETKKLYDDLTTQIKLFENKRNELKDMVWEITTNRLIDNVDRKNYADKVENIRKKASLINLNIARCKALKKKLDETTIGKISRNLKSFDQKNDSKNEINSLIKNDENLDKILAKLLEEKISKDIKRYLIKSFESEKKDKDKNPFDRFD